MLPVIPGWARIAVIVGGLAWLQWQVVDYVQTVERTACDLRATKVDLADVKSQVMTSEVRREAEAVTNQIRTEALDEHTETISEIGHQRAGAVGDLGGLRADLAATRHRLAESGATCSAKTQQLGAAIEAAHGAFEACAGRYLEVAADADECGASGLLCEREYDSLTPEHPIEQGSTP